MASTLTTMAAGIADQKKRLDELRARLPSSAKDPTEALTSNAYLLAEQLPAPTWAQDPKACETKFVEIKEGWVADCFKDLGLKYEPFGHGRVFTRYHQQRVSPTTYCLGFTGAWCTDYVGPYVRVNRVQRTNPAGASLPTVAEDVRVLMPTTQQPPDAANIAATLGGEVAADNFPPWARPPSHRYTFE